jgi:outer membrane protein assembly factor BamB
MKKMIFYFVFLITSALTASAQNIQWRGTDRTGIYTESGLLKSWPAEGPKLLWHYDGLGEGHSSVAVDDNKLYLTGMTEGEGYLYVFNKQGKLLFKRKYGPEWNANYNGTRGTVTINENKIYLLSGMGGLYCFDKNTLDVLWQKDIFKEFEAENITWGVNEAPLIIGDKVIATPGGKKNNLVALDKKTGKLIWSSPGKGDLSAYCSPLYIGDQETPLITTMTANHIIGIDASNGKLLWSHENKNRHSVHANTPTYSDNQIVASSGYGRGSTALKLKNGGKEVEEVWFSKELDNRIGATVKVGDYLYGSGDANKFWFCLDWKTGEIKWQEKGLAAGNIISNDGYLYLYTEKGEFVLAKATPEKFDLVSQFQITMGTDQHWAHPVIYDGVIYVRHGNTLMAYGIK